MRPSISARNNNKEKLAGRCRRWCFRLLAAIGLPLGFLVLLEIGLRLFNIGYPSGFLLPSENHGRETFVQNNQFTWRFFGPRLERKPHAFSIARKKDPGTVRIFVFGESAAYGDPQPEFGLPRMLLALLSLRHPDAHFEVVNTGITAINSHVIRDIARACAKADGDIWVIYMGNNEVVGPGGAGTIFGPQTPPLWVIRAGQALKATRLGELLDGFRRKVQPNSSARNDWAGMQMFLGAQVRQSDPRMSKTYDYFARNLADIIRLGRDAGAAVVVSTVPVNVKDCAPFGSEHRMGLNGTEWDRWDQFYKLGERAQEDGQYQKAADDFRAASLIDDTFADLRFREGQCALALREVPEAQKQFNAALAWDTLRFRCDRELNGLIRQTASNGAAGSVLLADTEKAFDDQSPDKLPGVDFFYEHVHPNFEGNYLCARTIADQVEKLLPERISSGRSPDSVWPSAAECARRLGWSDHSRLEAVQIIERRLQNPPFVNQSNHDLQMRTLARQAQELAPAAQPAGILQAEELCRQALAVAPDDPELNFEWAKLKAKAGDVPGAIASMRREVDAVPSDANGWGNLGLFLEQQKEFEQAAVAFHKAMELDPLDVKLRVDAGGNLGLLGRNVEAEEQFRQALKLAPDLVRTRLNLAIALMRQSRKAEALTELETILRQEPTNALALQYAAQLRQR